MNANGKSDGGVVPPTGTNKAGTEPAAEFPEGRPPANWNADQSDLPRSPARKRGRSLGLAGVRETARAKPELRFTSLLHHVNEKLLTEAFFDLKKTAAVGVDEVTWHDYEEGLAERIVDLHGRVHRGAYRAKPSKRIYIPKPDGRLRPIGVASLEDKIVQKAIVWVLQSIYEEDFAGFSYGFRPGRSQHMALDALSVAIGCKKVNWVLDADIEGFFDNIDHEKLMGLLELRIGDQRVLRLIRKWLIAGVSEDGQWSKSTVGTPQGAVVSPLLANVFLHYVLDQWVVDWRKRCRGEVVIVRYADDFVMGFQNRYEAEAFLDQLREHLAEYGLKLHDDKTRLIEFGRFAAERRGERGEGRPETFDFLGFTHRCSVTRSKGWFMVARESVAKRMRATLAAIKAKLRQRRHWEIGLVGEWLERVVRGWMGYHAVPGNMRRLQQFRDGVMRRWLFVLRKRSQRHRWTWSRLKSLCDSVLPKAKILHPYPEQRHRVRREAGAV